MAGNRARAGRHGARPDAVSGLFPSLAQVGGILLLSTAAGHPAAGALLAHRTRSSWERLAWAFALGLLILGGYVPLCLAVGIRPGWMPYLLLCGIAVAAGRPWRRPSLPPAGSRTETPRKTRLGLLLLLCLGLLLYSLRALTEPMWSTDYLAIWGWKGKTIFGSVALPAWTWRMPELGFTHPEYPLGLPFLYAGISFLLGRFDDHAMALLFPALQAATALLLAGWLRSRAAPPPVPLAAAAALSLFEPLYRGFTTGMAEVPLSFVLLLAGTALSDVLEGDPAALGRLAVATAAAAALKNEGLFVAAVAAFLALAARRLPWRERLRVAGAALLPALAVVAAHRILRGPLPLRDFEFGLLGAPEFPSRLWLGLTTILSEAVLPAAPALIALTLLFWAGRPSLAGGRLLALVAIPLAAYAILPAFCVFGPDWLVRTSFARTASALAPLLVAGLALRLSPLFESPAIAEPESPLTLSGGSIGSAAGPAA